MADRWQVEHKIIHVGLDYLDSDIHWYGTRGWTVAAIIQDPESSDKQDLIVVYTRAKYDIAEVD